MMLLIAGLLIVTYFLSFQIMYTLAHVSGQAYWLLRVILLPGVVLHESAHALACLLTGTHIQEISFWDEQGGHVIHHKPKLSLLTQPLISFAPFPAGIAALAWLSSLLPTQTWWLNGVIGFFILSIAGTLAPSKTDMIAALQGTVILGIIFGSFAYAYPGLFTNLDSITTPLSQTLLVVVILLLVMCFILYSLRHLLHYTRRQ